MDPRRHLIVLLSVRDIADCDSVLARLPEQLSGRFQRVVTTQTVREPTGALAGVLYGTRHPLYRPVPELELECRRRMWIEVAADAGKAVATINIPGLYARDRVPRGAPVTCVVTPSFSVATGADHETWICPPGAVEPVGRRSRLAGMRVHPSDITSKQIMELVPHADAIDDARDTRLSETAHALAESSTVHAAATDIAQRIEPDVMLVRYTLLADAPVPERSRAGVPFGLEFADTLEMLAVSFVARLWTVLGGPALTLMATDTADCSAYLAMHSEDELRDAAHPADFGMTMLHALGLPRAADRSGRSLLRTEQAEHWTHEPELSLEEASDLTAIARRLRRDSRAALEAEEHLLKQSQP